MFYTPEEKLVLLRKKFKITQKELSEGVMARSFLGMIETNNKKLTEKTAILLCEKFNIILSKQGINENVNVKDLLKSKREQAKEYLRNVIIKQNLNFFYIDLALCNLLPEERNFFLIKLTEILKNKKNFKMANLYLKKIIIEEKYELNIKLTILDLLRINYFSGDFQDSIDIYENFNEIINLNFDETTEKIRYNYSYALYKTNLVTAAKKELEAIIKKATTPDIIFKSKSLLASILYESYSDYKESSSIYKKLYRLAIKINNFEQIIIILANLLKIELIRNTSLKLIKFNLSELENLEIKFDSLIINEAQLEIFSIMAKAFFRLKNQNKAKEYYLKAIEIEFSLSNYKKISSVLISELITILDTKDVQLAKKIEENYIIPASDYKNILNLMCFYRKNNFFSENEELLNKFVDIFSY